MTRPDYAQCVYHYGRSGCMLAAVERDAAFDEEAAKVLDYEPGAICEDCPHRLPVIDPKLYVAAQRVTP